MTKPDPIKLKVPGTRKLISRINTMRTKIAKDRDALRELIGELEDIENGCDEAVQSLDYAADAMSRMV